MLHRHARLWVGRFTQCAALARCSSAQHWSVSLAVRQKKQSEKERERARRDEPAASRPAPKKARSPHYLRPHLAAWTSCSLQAAHPQGLRSHEPRLTLLHMQVVIRLEHAHAKGACRLAPTLEPYDAVKSDALYCGSSMAQEALPVLPSRRFERPAGEGLKAMGIDEFGGQKIDAYGARKPAAPPSSSAREDRAAADLPPPPPPPGTAAFKRLGFSGNKSSDSDRQRCDCTA